MGFGYLCVYKVTTFARQFILRKNITSAVLRVLLPFTLGAAILYWMYRGSSWDDIRDMVLHRMQWSWMIVSLLFGILPQVLRGLRWRLALEPVGEKPRRATCVFAVFVSYAASLVVPRIGEITRCGTLLHHDGTSFPKSLGTVVTERIVDALFMLAVTVVALFAQRKVFSTFFTRTGMNFDQLLGRFTTTGFIVAVICVAALVVMVFIICRHFDVAGRFRRILRDLWEGIMSLRRSSSLPLYLFYSFAIWFCYYLHFSLTLLCFDFTGGITQLDALVIFCAGSYAVLIPTPNGAGPWHFAVKTMLVLYGVNASDAILFALVVHAMQTGLIIVLGVVGLIALQFMKTIRRPQAAVADN